MSLNEYCCRLIERRSFLGITYPDCPYKAKYFVKYKDGIRGKIQEEKLCGVHYRALEKVLTNRGKEFIKVKEI